MYDDVIDEAIELAALRTHSAQERAAAEIDDAGLPRGTTVDVVARRAEDLEALTGVAASPQADEPTDEP